jgi:hypothetical protein
MDGIMFISRGNHNSICRYRGVLVRTNMLVISISQVDRHPIGGSLLPFR